MVSQSLPWGQYRDPVPEGSSRAARRVCSLIRSAADWFYQDFNDSLWI